MKKKTIISIIALVTIFIIQIYFIYNKSYAGYILNPKYKVDKLNFEYLILTNNLRFIKEYIKNDKTTNLSMFIDNSDNKYSLDLQYHVNKAYFYPVTMPAAHRLSDINNYNDDELKEEIKKYNLNYIVIVGKNISRLGIMTYKDISLYKINKDYSLELIADYNNDLYTMKQLSEKYHKNFYDKSIKLVSKYFNSQNIYDDLNNASYIYELANSLLNDDEKLAKKFYDMYLKLPAYNEEIIVNQSNIYKYYDDINNFNRLYNECSSRDDCDLNKIDYSMQEVE